MFAQVIRAQYKKFTEVTTLSFLLFSTAYAQESTTLQTLENKTETLEKELALLKQEMTDLQKKSSSTKTTASNNKEFIPLANLPVVATPFVGRRPIFNPVGNVIYGSYINQDIRYMEQRKTITQSLGKNADSIFSYSPIVTLNGIVEPFFIDQQTYKGTNEGKMTLASLVFNAAPIINPWVGGAISITHNTLPLPQNLAEGGTFADNQGTQINQAFVNIGNLSQTPFYMTVGQEYLPFGQEYTNMITIPVTTLLGSTKLTTAAIGKVAREDNDFFANIFAFNSKTTLNNSAAGGFNMGYKFQSDNLGGNIGASVISSFGDSRSLQSTGAPTGEFQGFGANSTTEDVGQVPGIDFYSILTVGPYNFIGEYVSALYPFDASALSYNGEGAQPSAFNTEITRAFTLFQKPVALALGYSFSSEALAINLPQQNFTTTFNMSLWPCTLLAIEFQHNLNYAASDYASGIGSTKNTTGTGTSADFFGILFNVAY